GAVGSGKGAVGSGKGAVGSGNELPEQVAELAVQLLQSPRHLGIHSGGMVLTERPVGEVVPIEHARMEKRTVIQWDKDDAAWMGLVKFDLLGLGMLAALQHCFDLVRGATGEDWELATIPKEEPGVYDMLCRADSIGVFQVESRAQIGLLPRLQPRRFYDLAIQIALIRPGPIQGGAVHPFVRRKLGREPVTYAHPLLEPVLERTLGVPVFQEQLMQMAMAVGGCTGEDADLLRRAMGSKRGLERIESLKLKLYSGMAGNGINGKAADHLYAQIQAFSNFGFAESHSLSFALLVYASAWIKLHYPAAFLAGLLRAQPMGFYSPSTLTSDARRHGVRVLRPDLANSGVDAVLEPLAESDEAQGTLRQAQGSLGGGQGTLRQAQGSFGGIQGSLGGAQGSLGGGQGSFAINRLVELVETPFTGRESCVARHQPPTGEFDPSAPDESASHRRDGGFAVRLGLAEVRGIGREVAEHIVSEREANGPFASMPELVRRTGLTREQLEALASADAFASLGLTRRGALWLAGSAAQDRPGSLPGTLVAAQPPLFGEPTSLEELVDDLWATGVSTTDHPIAQLRAQLTERGVLSTADLATADPSRRVLVGGMVTHRQRPGTASGITFVNIEDEFGLLNVVCSVGLWNRYRRVARSARALIVAGKLERSPEGVMNILADHLEELPVLVPHTSRDFH
ncbi:MAG TPA: helix-hairpin-helix domain-containing protein, partial [Propionicimonas sp.]|nr:helix-hairpin-helix domain-containing protein [Propionicimonas sp.]